MELIKAEKPLEFKRGDVTFFIKPRATSHDRFLSVMSGEMKSDGSIAIKRSEFSEVVLRNFILGWEGVKMDGKPVPYSWEAFITGWPKEDDGQNIFVELTNFVLEHTDYSKKQEELKKASPQP